VKRRDFITLLGGAAAVWPLAARARSRGYLWSGSSTADRPGYSDISRPRSAKGWVRPVTSRTAMSASNIAGRRVKWIDCRRLARELVRAQVAVICAGGPPSALTATDRSQLANASYCAHSRSVTSLTAVRESKERPSLPSSQRG